ncbi:MAG: phenylalanine 4-monooxygenase [Polaromonas sp.]|nr:phenylalanine 4-monooxygenase [Polaromonas sp.]
MSGTSAEDGPPSATTSRSSAAGVAPAVYGQSDRPPRGDYARDGLVNADYTCPQNYGAYTAADHDTYRRLYERQSALLPGLACTAFIDALPSLGASDHIPRFDDLNERLFKATGWEVVAVPGLIPEVAFFSLLASRRFPVTDWIRTPAEFDYIVEPDIFHDMFGHVPLLFNPVFADHMQAYGAGGLKAHALGACEQLSRLYWYTIEFGLIREAGAVRAYGAGILSSPGELVHAVTSPAPQRILLDVLRTMRTLYKIDSYQQTYFVIDSFADLFRMTAPDFTPLYSQLKNLPVIAADGAVDGDQRVGAA